MNPPAKLILLALLLALLASPAQAGRQIPVSVAPDSGIDMQAVSLFEFAPRGGYLPVRLTIQNNTNRARRWTIKSQDLGQAASGVRFNMEYSRELEVPAQSRRIYEIMLPMASRPPGGWYSSMTVTIEGYGVTRSVSHQPGPNLRGGSLTPYVLMGRELSLRSWEPLRNHAETKASSSLAGSIVDTSDLPSDWRGYLGVAQLLLTEAEWGVLNEAQKKALELWLNTGGHLVIFSQNPSSFRDPMLSVTAHSKPAGESFYQGAPLWQVGLGRVKVEAWDGADLPPESLFRRIDSVQNVLEQKLHSGYGDSWTLKQVTGSAELVAALTMVFMIIFAVLVGPVNLFVFASRQNRHRLFWTTPLISLGACLLLAVIILLKDGIGANGNRLTALYLNGRSTDALIIQEQSSLSGLLLRQSFGLDEETFMLPVNMTSAGKDKSLLDIRPRERFGDWFSSRTANSHVLLRQTPNRWRIELDNPSEFDAGAPPVIVSSIPVSLKSFYFEDRKGRVWTASLVPTGKKTELTPVPEPLPLLKELHERLSRESGGYIHHLVTQPCSDFVAIPETTEDFAIETLPAIRWKKSPGLIFGNISGLPSPAPPPTGPPSATETGAEPSASEEAP